MCGLVQKHTYVFVCVHCVYVCNLFAYVCMYIPFCRLMYVRTYICNVSYEAKYIRMCIRSY